MAAGVHANTPIHSLQTENRGGMGGVRWGGVGFLVRVVGAGFQLKYKYYIYPSLVDCIPRLRDNLK